MENHDLHLVRGEQSKSIIKQLILFPHMLPCKTSWNWFMKVRISIPSLCMDPRCARWSTVSDRWHGGLCEHLILSWWRCVWVKIDWMHLWHFSAHVRGKAGAPACTDPTGGLGGPQTEERVITRWAPHRSAPRRPQWHPKVTKEREKKKQNHRRVDVMMSAWRERPLGQTNL